jgi:uncharacterized protein (TIRG00374 family)
LGTTQKQVNLRGLALRVLPPILALAIIAWLLSQISLRDVTGLLSNLSYLWLAVGVGCYFVTNVCRAFRLKVLLPNQTTHLPDLVSIAIAQSMFNNILPARVGELSLVYLLNRYERVPLSSATVALILARVFDLVAVAAIFVVAALVSLGDLPEKASIVIRIVSVAMVLMVAVLVSAVRLGGRGLRLIQRILGYFELDQHPTAEFGLAKMLQVMQAFEAIQTPKRYLYVFIWSLFVWFGTFAWFYAFLRSTGVQVAVTSLIVGSTFAVLSKAIPFISIGGLGAHEVGWTAGFILVGLDKTTAIASGFAVNILTILSSVVLGTLGLLRLRNKGSA